MFHTYTALSSEFETIQALSIEIETDLMGDLWPENDQISPPVCTSHNLTVLSSPPDARRDPSDENATDLTKPVCPERTASWLPTIAFRMIMSPEKTPTATVSPQHERAYGVESKL